MKLKLHILYYYSFLATFSIIVFSNIIPSDWIILTRPFVIFTIILSLFLLNNTKLIIFIFTFYTFVIIFSIYSFLLNDVAINAIVNNIYYSLYFIFMFGLVYMMKYISLHRLLYSLSIIFIIKLLAVAIIGINLNFGAAWFLDPILNGITLNVHELFGHYRVFDVYLFLFPILFIFTKNTGKIKTTLIHALLFFNVILSMTFGFIFAYIFILMIEYKLMKKVLFLLSIGIFIFHNYFLDLYEIVSIDKNISIEVKINQYKYIIDNLSIWGQGLGTLINIQGRVDTMLENTYIYWLVVYGIIGTIFMVIYFLIIPFMIYHRFKQEFPIVVLFYTHLSALLVTSTNPILESVIGIIAMTIIISYFFSRKMRDQNSASNLIS